MNRIIEDVADRKIVIISVVVASALFVGALLAFLFIRFQHRAPPPSEPMIGEPTGLSRAIAEGEIDEDYATDDPELRVGLTRERVAEFAAFCRRTPRNQACNHFCTTLRERAPTLACATFCGDFSQDPEFALTCSSDVQAIKLRRRVALRAALSIKR